MLILKKLYQFSIPVEDMVHIYCMYIRSIAEQSSVVWSSSLTKGEEYDQERIQKVALRIIFSNNYITYEHALSVTNLQHWNQEELSSVLTLHLSVQNLQELRTCSH